jgi:hypothetical protein
MSSARHALRNGTTNPIPPNARCVDKNLFSKDVADVADVAGVTFPARASPELRITQVDNTFRLCGMGHHLSTLHDDIEWSYENLRLLAPFAQHMLASTFSVQEPGAVRIDLSLVGSGLTLMSNVLPQISCEEHNLRRQWSEADQVTWKEMMTIIWRDWRVIAPSAGLYLDREAMHHALVAALFDNVLDNLGRFDQRSVFFGLDLPAPFCDRLRRRVQGVASTRNSRGPFLTSYRK